MNDQQIIAISELLGVSLDSIAEDPDRDDLFSLYPKTDIDSGLFSPGQEFIIIRDPDQIDPKTRKIMRCETIKDIIRDQHDRPVILEDLISLPVFAPEIPTQTQIAAVMSSVWYMIDGRLYTYGEKQSQDAETIDPSLTAVLIGQTNKRFDHDSGSFYHISSQFPKVYLS